MQLNTNKSIDSKRAHCELHGNFISEKFSNGDIYSTCPTCRVKKEFGIEKSEPTIINQSDNKTTVTYNFTHTSSFGTEPDNKIKELQVQVKELQDVLNNILNDKLK